MISPTQALQPPSWGSENVFNGGKRKRVNRACSQCQKQHLACNEGRPCQRCTDRGIGHLCKDGERKQRGRKRKARAAPDLKGSGNHAFADIESDDGSGEDAYIPPPPTTKRQQQLMMIRQRQQSSLVAPQPSKAPSAPRPMAAPTHISSLIMHAPQPKRAKRTEFIVDIEGEGDSMPNYITSLPEPTASAGPSPAPSRAMMHSPPPQGTITPGSLMGGFSDLHIDDGTADSSLDDEDTTTLPIMMHSSSSIPAPRTSRSHANVFGDEFTSRLQLTSAPSALPAASSSAPFSSSPMNCSVEAHYVSQHQQEDSFGNLDEFFEKDRHYSAFPSSWSDRSFMPLEPFY